MSLSNIKNKIANKYMIIPTAVLSCALGFFFNPEIKTKNNLESRINIGISEACAFERGNYKAPAYNEETNEVTFKGEVYRFHREKMLDTDEDGIKETQHFRFINSPNKRITRYIKDNITWAWGIMRNRKDRTDLINNYAIIDSDGRDGFDEKYFGNEGFGIPKYLK